MHSKLAPQKDVTTDVVAGHHAPESPTTLIEPLLTHRRVSCCTFPANVATGNSVSCTALADGVLQAIYL